MNISLSGITKEYNGTRALSDCDALIVEGKLNAVIGPNGSGKSTLLRIASLIEHPDNGEVTYRDTSIAAEKDISLRRRIAVVLPGDTLFNSSVFRNVAYGLGLRKLGKQETRERVRGILDVFKMSAKVSRHVRELSTGEAQRVALARAMVIRPEFLFLDEPTASLDPVNTEIIENVLRSVRDRGKITIMMVTHNMFQAKRMADRVMLMHGGKVVEEGETGHMFGNPEKEITRRFIEGTMVY